MATKLGLINAALVDLGQRRLADTGGWSVSPGGSGEEQGRDMNAVYDRVVADCLNEASWNFSIEMVALDGDTGLSPGFGYRMVFVKPSDWQRTIGISQDEYFVYPLTQYFDDKDHWAADVSPLYVRYVSNDTGAGLNLSRWTPAFTRYVELELAARAGFKITSDKKLMEAVYMLRDRARKVAKNQDAMNEPNPKFPPPSSWTRARWGGAGGRGPLGDGGAGGRLTG